MAPSFQFSDERVVAKRATDGLGLAQAMDANSVYCHRNQAAGCQLNALSPECLLSPHSLYLALAEEPEARRVAYRALFTEERDGATETAIRDATQKGWALGNDRFKEEIAHLTERRVVPAKPGRPRKQEAADAT